VQAIEVGCPVGGCVTAIADLPHCFVMQAIGKLLLGLNEKVRGVAYRVPTPDVSLVDLNVRFNRRVPYDEIREAIQDQCITMKRLVLKCYFAHLMSFKNQF
jgi:glyceraldehyde-3-phosphate dehydrogenase/erythrose-4-phosphate dehydrogenase